MGPRSVAQVFQQFQTARTQFAQAIAEMSGRPDCVEQLLQENVLQLLHGLLGDVSVTIQQNAATAVGKLASHSPSVAEMVVRADLLRKLIYSELEKPNRYLKRAVLTALRSIVKQSPDLAKNVIEVGGLDFVVGAMEEFDAGVKEAAAFVLGGTAKHNLALATEVIGSGAVPLLVLSLQEPELIVRIVAANALSDISKHSPDTAQAVIDSGAVPHLVRATGNPDARLRRAALFSLASIAKHTLDMAEIIVEADVFPMVLEHAGHPDELVRKAANSLIKEIVKHSPDLAQLVVEGGGLGVLVNCIVRNKGENRLPAILALGFIAGHSPSLSFTTIYSKGIEALALAMDDEPDTLVGASAAWSLGHIGRHSPEHAKHITSLGLLPRILQVYCTKGSSEEMKSKAKQALKMILLRTDDLESVEPLLTTAPPQIFKYVVAQYSKILPKDPAARKDFVTSGGLRKIQELLTPDAPEILREHIILINSCYPPEVVNYFSPDYPQTLLDSIESFKPTLNIDPSMWTEKLFSDTKIPADVKDEILALQRTMHENQAAQIRKASLDIEKKKSMRASGDSGLEPPENAAELITAPAKPKKSMMRAPNPTPDPAAPQDPGKRPKKSMRPTGDNIVPLKV